MSRVIDQISCLAVEWLAYKEGFLDTFMFFAEGILDANLGEKHFLSLVRL